MSLEQKMWLQMHYHECIPMTYLGQCTCEASTHIMMWMTRIWRSQEEISPSLQALKLRLQCIGAHEKLFLVLKLDILRPLVSLLHKCVIISFLEALHNKRVRVPV